MGPTGMVLDKNAEGVVNIGEDPEVFGVAG